MLQIFRKLTVLIFAFFLIACPAVSESIALYPIRENGLWGYMNKAGETVIEPQWAYAWPFDGETALVSTFAPTDPSGDPVGEGIIGRDGRYAVTPAENVKIEDNPSAYRIQFYDGNEQKSFEGFYDKASSFYQPPLPEYEMVMLWGDDGTGPIAVENKDGLTGYVDRKNGEIAIPFIYTGESDDVCFHDGYARPADEILIEDANGVTLMMGSRMYLIDTQGREITFSSGISPASAVYDGYFFYTMETDAPVPEDGDEDSRCDEEDDDDSWFLGDGTEVVFPLYSVDGVTGSRHKLENWDFLYRSDNQIGLGIAKIDGTIVSQPDPDIYYMWPPDSDGMVCILSDGGACGHMDLNGNVIVSPRYVIDFGGAMPYYGFCNGYAVVEDCGHNYPDSYRWVILDTAGNEIFSAPGEAEDGSSFDLCDSVTEHGLVWYGTSEGYGLMKLTEGGAQYVTDAIFDEVRGYSWRDMEDSEFHEGLHPVKQNGYWGYIGEDAQWVIEPQFDTAANFRDGLAIVMKDGKLMYIDRDGTIVWEEK